MSAVPLVQRLRLISATLKEAAETLERINEIACYACEEDTSKRYEALLLIGKLARSEELDEEARANARLIAAAPELLALLREAESLAVIGDIEEDTEAHGWGKWLANTRAILAKVVRP